MASRNILLCAFIALVAVNSIIAEDEASPSDHDNRRLPFPFSFFPNPFQFFSDSSSREARSVDDPEHHNSEHASDGEAQHQDRFFFFGGTSSFATTCNYTTQPGLTCASCTGALRCSSNNVGILRICRGFLPYCNGGRCSFIPGSQCSG